MGKTTLPVELRNTPWNKGLTKWNNEKIEEIGKKISISNLGRVPWNKGLTAKTDERVKKHAEKLRGVHRSGDTKRKISLSLIGHHHTVETILKMSKTRKGRPSNRKGARLAEEVKRKISLGLKDRVISEDTKRKLRERKISDEWRLKNSMFHIRLWQNPIFRKKQLKIFQSSEWREKTIKNALRASFKRPTNLEQDFIDFFSKYNLPFSYCGDGTLLIGYKNPDFYENNGKKVCLEVANKIEKSIKRKGRDYNSWQEYEKFRINHFAKYGWKCIVLWQEDLQNLDGIQNIFEKLRSE